jgi:hypothetical protein
MRNKNVAVGVGVMVAVLVARGVIVGVLVGGKTVNVCVCAAAAVRTTMVSTEPGSAGEEGGDATSTGVPQLKITNPIISHNIVRRTIRLLITYPLKCYLKFSFTILSYDIESDIRVTEAAL